MSFLERERERGFVLVQALGFSETKLMILACAAAADDERYMEDFILGLVLFLFFLPI